MTEALSSSAEYQSDSQDFGPELIAQMEDVYKTYFFQQFEEIFNLEDPVLQQKIKSFAVMGLTEETIKTEAYNKMAEEEFNNFIANNIASGSGGIFDKLGAAISKGVSNVVERGVGGVIGEKLFNISGSEEKIAALQIAMSDFLQQKFGTKVTSESLLVLEREIKGIEEPEEVIAEAAPSDADTQPLVAPVLTEESKEIENSGERASGYMNPLQQAYDFNKARGLGVHVREIEYDQNTKKIHIDKFVGEPAEHSGKGLDDGNYLCGRTLRRNACRSGVTVPNCNACDLIDNLGNDGSTIPLSVIRDRKKNNNIPEDANAGVMHLTGKTDYDHAGRIRKIEDGPKAGERVGFGVDYYGSKPKMQDPHTIDLTKDMVGEREIIGVAFYQVDQQLIS